MQNKILSKYQMPNKQAEKTSIFWFEQLFNREEVFTNFKIGDRIPDIDGTFSILKNYQIKMEHNSLSKPPFDFFLFHGKNYCLFVIIVRFRRQDAENR
ncbi:hypothetical protein EZS27_020698 [termite gut metagenome]|uniref:Uncharacterized protein n=1 Tax=termite gut metagenome TaxID=433724 RepID=A0A5J4RAM5_9ZZZZ